MPLKIRDLKPKGVVHEKFYGRIGVDRLKWAGVAQTIGVITGDFLVALVAAKVVANMNEARAFAARNYAGTSTRK